jgi:hypothetical protein
MQAAPVTTATSVATNDYQREVLTALQTMGGYVGGVVTALVNVGALPIDHLLPAPVAASVNSNPLSAPYYGPGPYHSGATQFNPRIGPNQIQQPVIAPQWQGAHTLIPAAQTQASDPLASPLQFTFPHSTQSYGAFYPGTEATASNPLYAPVARTHDSAHIQGAHLQGAPYGDTFGFDQPNNTTERDEELLQGSSSGITRRDFAE